MDDGGVDGWMLNEFVDNCASGLVNGCVNEAKILIYQDIFLFLLFCFYV